MAISSSFKVYRSVKSEWPEHMCRVTSTTIDYT